MPSGPFCSKQHWWSRSTFGEVLLLKFLSPFLEVPYAYLFLRPASGQLNVLSLTYTFAFLCLKSAISFPLKLFNMAPWTFSSQICLQQNSSFHQMLTNIPSSMVSTVLLNLSGFIFASASFCKQRIKIFSKTSSHPDRAESRAYVLAAMLVAVNHHLTVIVPLSQIQDSSKQANPMSRSAPIHICLTNSINIRLTHGSRKTVASTRFHKKGRAVCGTPGMFSTLGDIIEYTGGVQYSGGYHEYSGGCLLHWGYHDECGEISWVHRRMFNTLGFLYKFSCFPDDLPPHLSWYPPVCSWYPPVYWTPPSVLMIFPTVLMISPQCTEILRYTAHTPVYFTDIMQGDNPE